MNVRRTVTTATRDREDIVKINVDITDASAANQDTILTVPDNAQVSPNKYYNLNCNLKV